MEKKHQLHNFQKTGDVYYQCIVHRQYIKHELQCNTQGQHKKSQCPVNNTMPQTQNPVYYLVRTYPPKNLGPQFQTPLYGTVVTHKLQINRKKSVRTQPTPSSTQHQTSGIFWRNSDNYFPENYTQQNHVYESMRTRIDVQLVSS